MKSMRMLLAACLALAVAWAAQAQTFPAQPIKWIVPFAAGGGTDNIARTLAGAMQQSIGTTIVIDNRPGAATNIGVAALLQGKADGYTVMQAENGALLYNEFLFSKLAYNPAKDFTYIGGIGRLPVALAVHPSLPVHTLAEFLAFAKANIGKADYASAGVGTPHHMAMELFQQRAGLHLAHIPYKGAAPALQDLVGGQVKVMMVDLASSLQYIRTGKIRIVAIAANRRAPSLPDVPTFSESGYEGVDAYAFQGLIGPAGMPADVVARLNSELNKALGDPKVVSLFNNFGFEPMAGTPEDFRAAARDERTRWGRVIKAAGVRLD